MSTENPLFEDSYARLFGPEVTMAPKADEFFTAFYRRFLQMPAIADLFADTDMTQQVQMLKRSVFQLVSFYVLGTPSAELKRIRMVHQRLEIPNHFFDRWLEAVVQTVAEFDDVSDEATLLAWRWALTPGITFMRLHETDLGE